MCCTRLAENTGCKNDAKKSPSGHHRTTLSGWIFATKACIDNWEKNLLGSNMSSTCTHNMANFGPLAAEIGFGSLGHPSKFQRLSRLGSVTARQSSSERQPNCGVEQRAQALNRGHHLCWAGRPARWALAHILVEKYSSKTGRYAVWASGGWRQTPLETTRQGRRY